MQDRINAALRRVPVPAVYAAGAVPALWLMGKAVAGQLGVDPVKALEHEFGLLGLQLMVAVLAVTPLRQLAGINLMKFRRAIGVLCFSYVLAHFLIWLLLDMQLFWGQILTDIVKRPYITVGFAAFVMLIPLAVTSNNASVRKLGGSAWRRLHKLTYPAAIAGAVHYVWLVKAWPIEPFVYLGAILALLAVRFRARRVRVAA